MKIKHVEWVQKGKKSIDGIKYWCVKCPFCGAETATRFKPFPCEKKVCCCGATFIGCNAYSAERPL